MQCKWQTLVIWFLSDFISITSNVAVFTVRCQWWHCSLHWYIDILLVPTSKYHVGVRINPTLLGNVLYEILGLKLSAPRHCLVPWSSVAIFSLLGGFHAADVWSFWSMSAKIYSLVAKNGNTLVEYLNRVEKIAQNLAFYAPLTLAYPVTRNEIEQGMTRLSTWAKWQVIWTAAWVCLHYLVVIWVAGYFNSPLYRTVYGVCHRQHTLWPEVRILF